MSSLLLRPWRPSAALLLSAVLCQLGSSQEVRNRPALAPLNPEFVRYRSDLERGRIRLFTSDGHPIGLIPLPMDISSVTDSGLVLAGSYPARYDMRTLGKLSPIRDQKRCGSCWSFATMASVESSLLPGSSNDFSENNMKDTHGFDPAPCNGGNPLMSLAYLARWSGAVREVDDPYDDTGANTSPASTSPVRHLQEAILLPPRSGPLDNDIVKQAVTQYGPVYISIYWDENSVGFSSTYNSLYGTVNKTSNHAVAVIGWDDNFSRYNFATTPPGNGAFIIRNSWGPAFGENGYFYLSYYDAVGGRASLMAVYNGIEPASNYSRVYQYDPLGVQNFVGYPSSETGWFANIFTAQSSESVAAVSFYTLATNSSYTVNVYTNVQGTPTNGLLSGTVSGTIATMGYHTIRLTTPVPVASGSSFSVVVKAQTPNSSPIPVEYVITGLSSHAVAHAGESFVSNDGTSWQDATTAVDATANVCLKAFTLTTSSTSTSVTLTTNPPSQEITADGTSYTSPHTFTWNVGSTHSIGATIPPASGGTRYAFANWSDSGAQRHTITVPSTATTYTANLNTQYLLTRNVSPAGSGSITASPSSSDGYYASGTSVQLTPAAASGYNFDSWAGDASGTATTASVTMATPRTVTANFRGSTATIVTTNPPGLAVVVDGTSYATPKTFSWAASSSHTIGATSPQTTSGARNIFANWSDGGAQTHTISAPAAGGTFTASFSPQYALAVSINPAGSGTVSTTPASADGYYNAGTSVTLAATPAAGYAFAGWSGGLTGATTPQSVAMNGGRTITANFGATAVSATNDSPSTAALVASLPYSVSQDTGGASSAAADPVHSCTTTADSRTVWFRYTATFNGTLRIDTFGSNYDTVLAVYNSTALAAGELACNDDADEFNITSGLTLTVTNGQALVIEVAGYGSSSTGGKLLLNIKGQPAPAAANDETGSATAISSLPARFTEDTSAATAGAADPVHSCTNRADGHTVWFRYIAAAGGYLFLDTLGSTYDTVLSIYDGAATTASERECNDDISSSIRQSALVMPITGGHTYLIEVSTWKDGVGGGLVLNAMPAGVAPSNDLVGNAIGIAALPYTIQEDTVDATQSASDPRHSCDVLDNVRYPDLRTVWFRYAATFTGTIQIDTYGSYYDTVLSAYPASDTSTELACNDDANDGTVQSAAAINVTAGKSYLIEVSEYDDANGGSGGLMQLNVNGTGVASIGNDEPASATAISSLPFTITQTTQPATSNSVDPVHSCTGKADSATVWFRYVATASGTLSVDAAGSDYYTVLAIYPGSTSPGAELGCSGDWTSSPRSVIRATVAQGQSYLIEASGWNKAGGGTLTLNASLSTGPASTSTINAAVNAAGQSGKLTPGGFATIWGTGLAATSGGWWDFPGGALPTSLNGVSVLVGGKKAYIAYVNSGQINVLVPGGSAAGAVPVQVVNASGASNVFTSQLQTAAPAFFTYNEGGGKYAIGSLPNGTLVGPIGLLGSVAVTQPAKPGDVIALWMSGLGPTTPAFPEGRLVTSPAPLANGATVTVGGAQATVDWAGVVGAGLYQVNFHVPSLGDGDQPIQVSVNGASAQGGVFITIGH